MVKDGAAAPAARARRHQGRPVRRAGREDLHRVQPRAARHAGRAGRPDPRGRAQAERHRRLRHGRDQGRARVGPRRRRADLGRASWRRCPSAPTAARSTLARRRRDQARLPGPAADLDALQRQAGDRARRRHGRPAATCRPWARRSTRRWRTIERDLPVGITVHRVANQPEVVDKSFEEFISSRWLEALGHRAGRVVHQPGLPHRHHRGAVGAAGAGDHLRRHDAARHRLPAHLARRADHRARPAGRRRHHRRRDDDGEARAGLQPAWRRRPTPTPRPPSRC